MDSQLPLRLVHVIWGGKLARRQTGFKEGTINGRRGEKN